MEFPVTMTLYLYSVETGKPYNYPGKLTKEDLPHVKLPEGYDSVCVNVKHKPSLGTLQPRTSEAISNDKP